MKKYRSSSAIHPLVPSLPREGNPEGRGALSEEAEQLQNINAIFPPLGKNHFPNEFRSYQLLVYAPETTGGILKFIN
jgi:hypothetical protein